MKKSVKIIILLIVFLMLSSIVMPTNVNAETPIKKVISVSRNDRIYKEPSKVDKDIGGEGLDDIIDDAQSFENLDGSSLGSNANPGTEFQLNTEKLQKVSSSLFTIAIIVATVISVIVGVIIGIKFVTGSIEAQAETKKLLKPYLIGCFVIYGAFGIWSLAINILSNV